MPDDRTVAHGPGGPVPAAIAGSRAGCSVRNVNEALMNREGQRRNSDLVPFLVLLAALL